MEAEDAKVELAYWTEMIYDGRATLGDLGVINEETSKIIDLVTKLVLTNLTNSGVRTTVEELMNSIEKIQGRLKTAIERVNSSGQLMDGRLTMVKEQLDL